MNSCVCPVCRDEWIFTTRICSSCDRIRHLMTIYDKQIILDILDKTLVVQRFQDNEGYLKTDKGKWIKKHLLDLKDCKNEKQNKSEK